MRLLITVACVPFANLSSGWAAEIMAWPESKPDYAIVSISGEIQKGDEQRFITEALKFKTGVVVLNSDGGDVEVAIEIGKAIRLKDFSTVVLADTRCASACGLIWLSGIRRLASPRALIGFHAAFFSRSGQVTSQGNALIGAYVNQLGFSQRTVAYITAAQPAEMKWLTSEDASTHGITFEYFDPEQTVSNNVQTVPAPPAAPPPALPGRALPESDPLPNRTVRFHELGSGLID